MTPPSSSCDKSEGRSLSWAANPIPATVSWRFMCAINFARSNRKFDGFKSSSPVGRGPSPLTFHRPGPTKHNNPSLSSTGSSRDRSSVPPQNPGDFGVKGQQGSDAHQPTLRAGRYIFTASPTGNQAIAYDPTTRVVKSVPLNATKAHPLKITPMTGDHVQLVALRIQGANITRVAVFDLESDKWLPMDLDEPVKGNVQPVYLGHSGTAYDLGRHVYTYNAKAKAWDHRDITTFSDDLKDEGAARDFRQWNNEPVGPIDEADKRL